MTDEVDIQISELETRIDRLRSLYEQYFMGIERMEPHVPRKDVERRLNDLRKVRFQNTAKRFKFQTLVQRYNTMQQHWGRVCREIENGTYRRHKLKAERTVGALTEGYFSGEGDEAARDELPPGVEPPRPRQETFALSELLDGDGDLDAELARAIEAVEARDPVRLSSSVPAAPGAGSHAPGQTKKPGGLLGKLGKRAPAPAPLAPLPQPAAASPQARPAATATGTTRPSSPTDKPSGRPAPRPGPKSNAPAARPAAPAAAPAAAHSSLSEDRIKSLHDGYQRARQETNASPVSLEKLARSIRETEAKLRAQHGGRNVDFDVVIQSGKAVLKPRLA